MMFNADCQPIFRLLGLCRYPHPFSSKSYHSIGKIDALKSLLTRFAFLPAPFASRLLLESAWGTENIAEDVFDFVDIGRYANEGRRGCAACARRSAVRWVTRRYEGTALEFP